MGAVDAPASRKGNKKGGKRTQKRIAIRIDMTPMVDVAFLLLIFFMVTTVFMAPQTMEINLPPSEQKVDVAESNLMILYITEGNKIFWTIGRDKPQTVSMKELQPLLAEKNKAQPKLITLVKLDRKARYYMMVDILDELNIGNVTRFSVAPLTDRDKEVLSQGMSMTSTMLGFVDYGSAELKRLYQLHVRKGFILSVAGHMVAVCAYLGIVWYIESREEKALHGVRIIKYSDLGPPPSITNQAAAPQIQVTQAAARPTIGIPEPVPDAEVSSETTIATQTEMSQMTSLVGGESTGEGSVIQVEQPVSRDENIVVEEEKLPEVGEFVPVEEQPVPVEQPKPVYPEIARRAGIEGTVWIMILVDRTGKVRDVRITKGPEMFHEAAKEAAWKSVWRPAIQNQKPFPVWVTYPIRFTLKG